MSITSIFVASAMLGNCTAAKAQASHSQKTDVTTLMHAAQNGSLQHLNTLIAGGAEVDAKDSDGQTALFYAAGAGHDDCLKSLIAAHTKIDLQDAAGETALLIATRNNRLSCAKALISSGADPNLADSSGETPLSSSIYSSNAELFRALVAANAAVAKVLDSAKPNIAACFGKIGAPAIAPLETCLENERPNVAQLAYECLEAINDPAAAAAIKYEQTDPDTLHITLYMSIIYMEARNGSQTGKNSVDGKIVQFTVGSSQVDLVSTAILADDFQSSDKIEIPFKIMTKQLGTVRFGAPGTANQGLWLLPCQKKDLIKMYTP